MNTITKKKHSQDNSTNDFQNFVIHDHCPPLTYICVTSPYGSLGQVPNQKDPPYCKDQNHRTPFQIAKLVEQEKGMVAGTAEVAVVGRPLLVAMGRADAAVHIENDFRRRVPVMNPVNPSAGKIGKLG